MASLWRRRVGHAGAALLVSTAARMPSQVPAVPGEQRWLDLLESRHQAGGRLAEMELDTGVGIQPAGAQPGLDPPERQMAQHEVPGRGIRVHVRLGERIVHLARGERRGHRIVVRHLAGQLVEQMRVLRAALLAAAQQIRPPDE